MHKLTFTLKQHTPIIHFQHDQPGATLRASEVKPRFDRFLKEELRNMKPAVYEMFKALIDKLPDSSNRVNASSPYKLVIHPVKDESVQKYIIASLIPKYKIDEYIKTGYEVLEKTPYFADNKPIKEGPLSDAKLGLMLKKDQLLKISFLFDDPSWIELFNVALPLFFCTTNFGTRQSKGFGCFLPVALTQIEFESIIKTCFPIIFNFQHASGVKQIFKEIEDIYKKLKAGDQKNESELRKYYNSFRPVIEWEKPAIQEIVRSISGKSLKIKSETSNRQFVRAVLGLPEIYEYPKHDEIKAQVKNDTFARYASPILFKVHNNQIYLIATKRKHENDILNKPFDFDFTHKGRNYGNKLRLITPKEFDLVAFLNRAMPKHFKWQKI